MAEYQDPNQMSEQAARDYANNLRPTVDDVRLRRRPVEEMWLRNHTAWSGRSSRQFFKSDVFKHEIPSLRRAIERHVIRAAQMLIPSNEFFEVYPGDEYEDLNGKEAESVRAFQMYLWTKRIKVYPFVRSLLRTYGVYGRAISKSGIEVIDTTVDTVEGPAEMKQVWPTVRCVDPFFFYYWPETSTDLTKAQLLFEDVMMPWGLYEDHMNMRLVRKLDRRKLQRPTWPDHHTRRLNMAGLVEPSVTQRGSAHNEKDDDKDPKPIVDFVHLSEIWKKHGSRYEMCWIVWNYEGGPLLVRENKKPFPVPPYRMAVNRDMPGEHYTSSMGDDLEPLSVLLNDQVNSMLEGQVTQFAPPVAIEPSLVTRADSLVFRPRAKWLVHPDGVKWLQPQDTTRFALQGIGWTDSAMDKYSGSSSLSEGTPTRNMPRAGFAVSSLLNLSMADIRDAALMIEDLILTPSLADTYRLAKQYIPEMQLMKIPGTQNFPKARRMTVEDLAGDWEFMWVGSLQFQDMQIRAQRLVATLGVLGKMGPQLQQELQAQGKRINWVALLKRIWRDGLGERGADTIIEAIPQQDMMRLQLQQMLEAQASGQMPPGGIPGPMAGTGNPEDVAQGAQRSMLEGSGPVGAGPQQ